MNTLRNKIRKGAFWSMLILGGVGAFSSCSDIMDTESDRKLYDPALDAKTDSIYYIQGMLRGMQQLADQYVLVGEFRGDLITTNSHTLSDLRALANFSADATNAYDSAYVYYRVINNCNYYIAHRDTSLLTGSTKVVMSEYVEAKALRAWAYMQLAKNYGTVPFTLDPVTSISDANSVSERKDLQGIADALLPDLLPYSGQAVPDYGNIDAGITNEGNTKTVTSSKTMLPVDLVIADLYLETNQYEQAARYYFKYLKDREITMPTFGVTTGYLPSNKYRELPNDMGHYSYGYTWYLMFSNDATPINTISYIPMAVNKQKGVTSNLPEIFGYDYYSTNVANSNDRYLVERMASPSEPYIQLANAQDFYYVPNTSATSNVVNTVALGDLRYYQTWRGHENNDSTFSILSKHTTANIFIYRENLVYLRLAEALNRMGYPDAAFIILKDGITADNVDNATLDNVNGYVRNETVEMLTNTIPFLSTENTSIFENTYGDNANGGIHSYGSGRTRGAYSPYQYTSEITKKLVAMNNSYSDYTFPVISPNDSTVTDSLDFYGAYAIDAVEDLICDELALETAGEGNRWGDLMRIANHKNADSTHGSNYGGIWLARKLAFKNPVKDLTNKNNWYLPLK